MKNTKNNGKWNVNKESVRFETFHMTQHFIYFILYLYAQIWEVGVGVGVGGLLDYLVHV